MNHFLIPKNLLPAFFRNLSLLILLISGNICVSSAQKNSLSTPGALQQVSTKDSKPQLFEKKKLLISVLEKQEKDWNSGDLKSFLSAYWDSDSLVSVSVRGVQYGKVRLEQYLNRTFPDSSSMGNIDYQVIHVEMIGESDALLTGKWLRKNDKKFRGGYFSILLRKLQSRWKIVSEHLG